jgi:hypothetical protein
VVEFALGVGVEIVQGRHQFHDLREPFAPLHIAVLGLGLSLQYWPFPQKTHLKSQGTTVRIRLIKRTVVHFPLNRDTHTFARGFKGFVLFLTKCSS